jgi:putative thioredoxin
VDFQKDVIERSAIIPVVVDFWAEWCGPCRVLGPVIEELAEENKGNWELVKLNTEEHSEVAREYRVMSIPNVKMFYQGEVISEFAGALPKNTIQQWLDRFLPSSGHRELEQILAGSNGWPDTEMAQTLKDFHAKHPDLREARLHLARQMVLEDPDLARELIKELPPSSDALEVAQDIRALADLVQFAGGDNQSIDKSLRQAAQALEDGDYKNASRNLIDAVTSDKTYAGGLPRRAAIALFRMLGSGHQVTREYRRQFDMALY